MTKGLLLSAVVLFAVGCNPVDLDENGNEIPEEAANPELETTEAVQGLNSGRVVICRGGYAPVRYYNPSTCGGSIHNWYPQGWHGWFQTGGGCHPPAPGTSGYDVYFHPNNGAHGGWIESWRLCNY